ncbi:MAG: GerMN domain-containing protein [Candidatus Staskawiczbacteria bacterium]|nr:GerMN domain-containing protein [Candidatus Staskawiczbacteria bacterium]
MAILKNISLILLVVLIALVAVYSVLFALQESSPEEEVKEPESDVIVLFPKPGEAITSPLVVLGEAKGTWFFEATFPIKITDEAGNVLGVSYVEAVDDWMTENFVRFSGKISFLAKERTNGFLVLAKDNPSGLPEYDKEVKVPVILEPVETVKVKVYFNNSKMDPQFSCNKVFPVEREIPKTEAIARETLLLLLKGPTGGEKDEGFFTSINEGVQINSIKIENGVATVDFGEQLEFEVGGSCRVSAIRAEITETLKQFSTVNSVVISINGRTEDILQP